MPRWSSHSPPNSLLDRAPADLRRLGVSPGEMIRVKTRRGVIDIRTRVDSGVPKGIIFIPFCYAEAAANLLTNPALDPIGKIPEFKFCAARVEKMPTMAAD
ncbi:MAG: molybdopterin dinucleotide binding domain-containing protein [Alphaproteobacteria bacterium]